MAIPIEGYSVVAKKDRILELIATDQVSAPNATAIADDHIWRCSFMTEVDAREFLEELSSLHLNVQYGPDSDAVLVNEFDQSVEPFCDWLMIRTWDKAVLGWLTGTSPESIVAFDDWDPKVGSGFIFHDPNDEHDLEFLRLEENVEVYLDKNTGEELFIGRSSMPIDALYETAADIITKHWHSPGENLISGEAAKSVMGAIAMLEQVTADDPDAWGAFWFHGKGLSALGRYDEAYTSFKRAFELERETEAIGRELANVCLETQRFNEAVQMAEHAATIKPDDAATIANLAICYLFCGRLNEASKSIAAAIKLAPADDTTERIKTIINEVANGHRELPGSLRDLSTPKKPRRFWEFWKR